MRLVHRQYLSELLYSLVQAINTASLSLVPKTKATPRSPMEPSSSFKHRRGEGWPWPSPRFSFQILSSLVY